jgi:hypothetical protein
MTWHSGLLIKLASSAGKVTTATIFQIFSTIAIDSLVKFSACTTDANTAAVPTASAAVAVKCVYN